jgi:2-oxoisovalerate dehydrogenase E1 component alpha subunit
LSEAEEQEMRAEIKAIVDRATEEAEQAPMPEPETLYDHVYAPPRQRR